MLLMDWVVVVDQGVDAAAAVVVAAAADFVDVDNNVNNSDEEVYNWMNSETIVLVNQLIVVSMDLNASEDVLHSIVEFVFVNWFEPVF